MKWIAPLVSFVTLAIGFRYVDLWSGMGEWLKKMFGYSPTGAEQVRGIIFSLISTYVLLFLDAVRGSLKSRIEVTGTIALTGHATTLQLRALERTKAQIEFRIRVQVKSPVLFKVLRWLDHRWAIRIVFPDHILTVKQNPLPGAPRFEERSGEKRRVIVVPLVDRGFSSEATYVVRVLVSDNKARVGSDQIYFELWSRKPWFTAIPVGLLVKCTLNALKVDVIA